MPAAPLPPRVDTTPELPKEFEVSSTSTLSTAARTITLDPETPGPVDLLDGEQLATYKAIYVSRPASMDPAEKHRCAWRAAVLYRQKKLKDGQK